MSADTTFSPDGSLVYAVSGNVVSVFRTSDGAFVQSYTFGNSLGRLDISPDGAFLAVVERDPSSGNGTIHRLSLATGAVQTSSFAGAYVFYDLAYLADGRLFVSQITPGPLRLINLDTSAVTSLGSIDASADVLISLDNSYALALPHSITRPIHTFDLDTATYRTLVTLPDPYGGASLPDGGNGVGAVSPDGSLIFFGMTGRLYRSDLQSYVVYPSPLTGNVNGGSGAAFSADGSRLYLISQYSDRISVIDVATFQLISNYDIRGDVTGIVELRVSNDGSFLAITAANGVQLINLTTAVPDALPSSGNDTLYGNANAEVISGLGGADVIYGEDGGDSLASYGVDPSTFGSSDSFTDQDRLYGGNGSDTLYAGYGDIVDGGTNSAEIDTLHLNLLGAPVGVTVDFRQSVIVIGGGTISGIENLGSVVGSNFADTINAGNVPNANGGYTVVLGMGGNDSLIAGSYTSSMDGGDGDDTLDGTLGGSTLSGGAGNDIILFASGSGGTALGGDGDDRINVSYRSHGGSGNDTIIVSASSNPWGHWGDSGNDNITGSSGADFLLGGSGADTIRGGAGNDVLSSADENPGGYQRPGVDMGLERDIVTGDDGNDEIAVGYGDDADGGAGTDTLYYSFGGLEAGILFDTRTLTVGGVIQLGGGTVQGFELVRQVTMTPYADQVTLSQNPGDLTVYGGVGDDVFTYMGFTDARPLQTAAVGGDGNDTLIVNARQFDEDVVFLGNTGSDTVDFNPTFDGVRVTLSDLEGNRVVAFSNGNVSQLLNVTFADVENLLGTGGSDRFIGNSQNNRLDGRGGFDELNGAAGNDILTGGLGIDRLTGGDGNDVFRDSSAGLSGDTITDFTENDRIIITDMSLSGFNFTVTGSTLSWSGGSVTLTGGFSGTLVATVAVGGGVQISTIPMIEVNDVRNDFNGDGISDILWRNVDGQMSNWLGQPHGGFTPNNANAAAVVPTAWQIAGTGDFNGDGRDDVLWRNTDGQISNWLAVAGGGYVQNNANAAAVVPTAWHVVGTGDFNGDGRDDILWRHNDGTVSDWLGTAVGGFTANDANAARVAPTTWHVVGTGDFNGDGRDDILWRSDSGQLSDWLGQANGGFMLNDAVALTTVDNAWTVAGTGDFNGDGRDDILWRNSNGQLSNWLGQANGGFVNNGAISGVFVPLAWSVVAVGDYNGDGRDDILWRNTNGTVTDWLGNANGSFTPNDANAAQVVPTVWHVQPEAPFL
ncbi:MAG: FG-GAP-like repeat-containing protein [Sphingomicrobium sp.]